MSQSATVIATFSRRMRLRLPGSEIVDAKIKGKRLKPVCGDRVSAEPIAKEADWLITKIEERRNALTRPNARGQVEVLAANIDLLVVVAAVLPVPDWFVVDRYLCAAEVMRVPALVVFNKIDLLEDDSNAAGPLGDYQAIEYPTVFCSARENDGVDELQAALQGRIAIIVGQSGVGKSSLINRLIPAAEQKTSDVSAKSREGKHTTVNSMMLELPGGGYVIDSPGVRDYAPALQSVAEVERGFREIHDNGHDCRFHNCRHLQEPGCAVKLAVKNERISARRYESYKRALRLTEDLKK